MAKWAHADVLDNGPAYIKTNCTKIIAALAYTLGDSYATVTGAANIIAEAALVTTDFAITGASGAARVLALTAGKQDASANNTGDPTHFVFVDTVNSKVLYVTDETSAQTVTAGNPVTFPGLTYTASQPV